MIADVLVQLKKIRDESPILSRNAERVIQSIKDIMADGPCLICSGYGHGVEAYKKCPAILTVRSMIKAHCWDAYGVYFERALVESFIELKAQIAMGQGEFRKACNAVQAPRTRELARSIQQVQDREQ